MATFTYDLSAGSISQLFVGITMCASVDGETAGEAITGTDGRYTLSLAPATYDLMPVYTGNEITRRRVQGLEGLRGATVTRNFDIRFQDLISVGGLR